MEVFPAEAGRNSEKVGDRERGQTTGCQVRLVPQVPHAELESNSERWLGVLGYQVVMGVVR